MSDYSMMLGVVRFCARRQKRSRSRRRNGIWAFFGRWALTFPAGSSRSSFGTGAAMPTDAGRTCDGARSRSLSSGHVLLRDVQPGRRIKRGFGRR